MRLMEWCYVVCSHERLRGHRPATPAEQREAIVLPLPASARRIGATSRGRLGRSQYALEAHGEVSEWLKERDWKSRGRG